MWHKSGPTRAIEVIPWIPVALGVVVLASFMVFAAVRLAPSPEEHRLLPAPPAAPVDPVPVTRSGSTATGGVPGSPAAGGVPASEAPSPTGRVTPVSESRTARPPAETRPVVTAPPAPVTGHYRVLSSYGDSFIGEVLISNSAAAPRDWTVTLTFAGNVGDLKASWLESLPQPTLSQSGQTYTWRSSVPLAPGSSGALRFDFARAGSGDTPARCMVDGAACR